MVKTSNFSKYLEGEKGEKSFSKYVRRALAQRSKQKANTKGGEWLHEISDTELDALYESSKPRFYEIYVVSVLQLLLAPLTEALVLIDRCVFLSEQGVSTVRLLPGFDPHISPRNMVIVAAKGERTDSGTSMRLE